MCKLPSFFHTLSDSYNANVAQDHNRTISYLSRALFELPLKGELADITQNVLLFLFVFQIVTGCYMIWPNVVY